MSLCLLLEVATSLYQTVVSVRASLCHGAGVSRPTEVSANFQGEKGRTRQGNTDSTVLWSFRAVTSKSTNLPLISVAGMCRGLIWSNMCPFSCHESKVGQSLTMIVWRHWEIVGTFACALLVAASPCQAQEVPAPVRVHKVVQRQITLEREFIGTATPRRRSTIGSAIDGRVMQMFVREGDMVQTKDPLVRLRTGTLEIELARVKAQLDLKVQVLTEMLNGSRPEEIEKAKAQVEGAQGNFEYAEARLRRARQTYDNGAVVTLDEVEKSLSQSIAAKNILQAARADYQMALKGPRKERIAQARSQVLVQNKVIQQIEDRIALHTLKAPFDGYIVKRHNEVGGWASAGKPVVEMVELHPMEVEVLVSEKFVTHVRPTAKAIVRFDALPDREFVGEVVRIVPQADLRSRTFPVKVQLENPTQANQPLIKAGMFARVTLNSRPENEVLMIPKDSLVLNGNRRIVFVVVPATGQDNTTTVKAVPVTLGNSDGLSIEVRGDITAGQEVVIKGNERLRPQQAVRIIP